MSWLGVGVFLAFLVLVWWLDLRDDRPDDRW